MEDKNKNKAPQLRKPKLHLVQLDENVLYDCRYADHKAHILYANIENHRFEGYLVNQGGATLYFEPKDGEGLIIVPHSWVKWCVPINKSSTYIKEKF